MPKLPYLRFYPSDWRADSVFGCSLAARGLWLEMMNMMHASERYGYLSQDGQPIPSDAISRYCGCSLEDYLTLLAELERARVPRRTKDGIIYSKRMVDDAARRADWRKRQKTHRKEASHADVTPMSPPSSLSLSLKDTQDTKILSRRTEGAFESFWAIYPRKVHKPEALRAWRKIIGADAHVSEIVVGVERWSKSDQWQEQRFIPHPARFLNQRQWEDETLTHSGLAACADGTLTYEQLVALGRAK